MGRRVETKEIKVCVEQRKVSRCTHERTLPWEMCTWKEVDRTTKRERKGKMKEKEETGKRNNGEGENGITEEIRRGKKSGWKEARQEARNEEGKRGGGENRAA